MSLELLGFQDIQDCQPHSTGHWVATKLNQGTVISGALSNGPSSHGIATKTTGKVKGLKLSTLWAVLYDTGVLQVFNPGQV